VTHPVTPVCATCPARMQSAKHKGCWKGEQLSYLAEWKTRRHTSSLGLVPSVAATDPLANSANLSQGLKE
jgi:hypothetical protein